MTEPSTRTTSRLISLPVFWQVMGLCAVVLVLALGINTLIVLKAPEPPPAGYSISEAATALKGGEVKLRNGRTLKSTVSSQAPAFLTQSSPQGPPSQLQTVVANDLADLLQVPRDRVQVRMSDHGMWRHRGESRDRIETRVMVMRRSDSQGMSGQSMIGDGPPPPPPGEHFEIRTDPPGEMANFQLPNDLGVPPFSVAWKQVDGSYRVITPPRTWIEPWQARLLLGFALTAALILPLAWLLSGSLSRPIIVFSDAAARLSFDSDAPPVLAAGPREVRQAAEVLNAMQARIKKQVEGRTALMGAIAHDLKTPLARMRLRIEDLPDPLRGKLGDDISHMDGLIKSAMSFTSAHKLAESLRPLDFSALVEALNDDLSAVCALEPPLIEHHVMVRGDGVALKRIVTNLVENAARYAGSCRLELSVHGREAVLIVADNGPGVPPGELDAVFEPFYRLETSRNRDTGGTGLGLSVARALAEAQGGSLTLANRYEGTAIAGCEARLVLPRLMNGHPR